MKVLSICKNYFNGFQEISDFKKNGSTKNVLMLLKILSYFTVIIPLSFAVTYGAASLYGRVSNKQNLPPLDKNIKTLAKTNFSKNEEEIKSRTVTNVLETDDTENEKITQPEVISDDWGKISLRLNGSIKHFKDVIILPSEGTQIAKEWNWKWDQEGMRHRPGIRIKDIEHLILSHSSKPDVIILSQGRGHGGLRENPGPGVLEVDPNLRSYIESQGIHEIYILKTVAAIEKYNEIRNKGKKQVAALIHTTC